MDLTTLSNEELLQLEKQSSQQPDLTKLSDEELLALEKQHSGNSLLGNEQIPEEKSAVSIPTRAWLSFHNDADKEKILRKDFSIVQRQPDGNFVVGNDIRDLAPVSPDGLMNDLFGKLADHAADIPVIAGQIGALALAPEAAIPARMALSGLGAGAGQALSSAVGQKNANEIATDVAASAAFGAAAEGIVQGAVTGAKVLAPKLSKMINKINYKNATAEGIAPEDTAFAKGTTKLFSYLANVPEASTQTFFKYGMNEMNNPVWFKKETVKNIVKETVDSLESTSDELGKEIAKQTGSLISLAKAQGQSTNIQTEELFNILKSHATNSGVLDDLGRVNRNYPNAADIKPMTNLLNELGIYKDGRYIADPGKSIPIDKALQISRSFGQKFDKVSGNVQAAFYDVLNGNGVTKGIRPIISETADRLGVGGYAQATKRYADFNKILDNMRSLDTTAPSKIEGFISRLENIGQIDKENLVALDRMTNKGLLKKWELWNAAQDFNKAKPDVLRFGSIAAIIGATTGFDSNQSRIGTIAAAATLGTPAGLKMLIRLSNKIGSPISREKLQEIGKNSVSTMNKTNASVVLNQILRSKENNKKNNDAKK